MEITDKVITNWLEESVISYTNKIILFPLVGGNLFPKYYYNNLDTIYVVVTDRTNKEIQTSILQGLLEKYQPKQQNNYPGLMKQDDIRYTLNQYMQSTRELIKLWSR